MIQNEGNQYQDISQLGSVEESPETPVHLLNRWFPQDFIQNGLGMIADLLEREPEVMENLVRVVYRAQSEQKQAPRLALEMSKELENALKFCRAAYEQNGGAIVLLPWLEYALRSLAVDEEDVWDIFTECAPEKFREYQLMHQRIITDSKPQKRMSLNQYGVDGSR